MNLVTGATGLLGTRVLFDLLQQGKSVRACKRKNSNLYVVQKVFQYYGDTQLKLFETIEWVDCDILDIIELQDAFEGVQHVYHCAALVSFHHSDYDQMYDVNVTGTHNLVNLALHYQVQSFCHVSSTAAVGKVKAEYQQESNPWKNSKENSYYAVTKYAAEREVWRGIEEGLNAVIVNPCILIGPGDWNRSSLGIFKTIHNGLRYFTKGGNAYVDVRDVSEIMIELMQKEMFNERYLCIGENLKFQDLFIRIAKAFKVKGPSVLAKSWQANLIWRLGELRYLFTKKKPVITRETARSASQTTKFSNQKIKKALGYEFTPIDEAVEYTANFLRQTP